MSWILLCIFKRVFYCDVKRFSDCVQQKILIRVTMTDDKARAKAMKTAVKFKGNNETKTVRETDSHNSC